jgi:CheY-like chemotaxis protein
MTLSDYILIVEDDYDIREALTEILEGEGYPVRVATNGLEALGVIDGAAAPCLILLDLMMPVMNGWQFRGEQLRRPRVAGVPVVVISANSGLLQKTASLGAAAVLRKPISIDVLLETIKTHCVCQS